MTQFVLDLSGPPRLTRDAFIPSSVNAQALATIEGWREGALALVGPAGSGKTHLSQVWIERFGPESSVDDAEGSDEDVLFHRLNQAAMPGRALLLTARNRPLTWRVGLPDLRSRLNALTVAELGEPDDALLEAVIVKLFIDRGIRPTDDVAAYLVKRMERSIDRARALVARIDAEGLAKGAEINRSLVRQILEISPETPDLFE